jgi:hypothetical protein
MMISREHTVEASGQKRPHEVLRSDTDEFTDIAFRRAFF